MKALACCKHPRHDQLTRIEPMDQSLEQWRPVVGYEGLYEVSDQGRVRSLSGIRWNGFGNHVFQGKILKPQKSGRYGHVVLSKNGKTKTHRIHVLVACAFLPSCPGIRGRHRGQYHIDHINNNPRDNRAANLQWLSHRDNTYVKANRKRNLEGQFI